MITRFISYLTNIRGYAANTAKEYEKDIRAFAHWMKTSKQDARWSTITREDLDRYITTEAERGLKPSTTNRKLASISAFYRWMKREGMEVENPCKYESRRKRPEQIPNTIPQKDLKAAYEHATGATRYLIGILMTTGIRIQEALDMTWENINTEDCSIKIQGKGGKSRLVYTTTEVLEPVINALKYEQKRGKMWHIDQRKARTMIYEALRPYSNAAQLSPHAIRHTFATNIANKGGNVTTLAQMLGHKHIETTQKYIDMAQAPLKRTFHEGSLFN